ncbi:MAG: nucleotidyltransferase domain-containing protein [Desulfuromonadales bacterium]|nr:MAG: nucleotidyltransferase domain-containing protein [Desulfuromonadales bacterium]
MIDLEEQYISQVREILARHVPACEVRMFGSRVRGTARKYSDIDLAIVGDGPLPDRTVAGLKEAFSESDIPYRVDVVDWRTISPEFRKVIEQQGFEVIGLRVSSQVEGKV